MGATEARSGLRARLVVGARSGSTVLAALPACAYVADRMHVEQYAWVA